MRRRYGWASAWNFAEERLRHRFTKVSRYSMWKAVLPQSQQHQRTLPSSMESLALTQQGVVCEIPHSAWRELPPDFCRTWDIEVPFIEYLQKNEDSIFAIGIFEASPGALPGTLVSLGSASKIGLPLLSRLRHEDFSSLRSLLFLAKPDTPVPFDSVATLGHSASRLIVWNHWYLFKIFTSPTSRGRGWAYHLIQGLASYCNPLILQEGLWALVDTTNLSSQALFRRLPYFEREGLLAAGAESPKITVNRDKFLSVRFHRDSNGTAYRGGTA